MRATLFLIAVWVISGCSAFSGITDIFSDEDNVEPPAELVDYEPEIEIETIWEENIGEGSEDLRLKLLPVEQEEVLYVADHEGLLTAISAETGDSVWEIETEIPFSGGPGIGNDTLILGSSDADVTAFNIADGKLLWETRVSSEVISVPAIEQGIVVVRAIDGKLTALSEENGEELWTYERNVPALSLRGEGKPLIINDQVIAGFPSGKLIALRLVDGKLEWESNVALPKGRSEVERLIDLDGDPVEADGIIFLTSYQQGVFAVLLQDGEILWRNEEVSSFSDMTLDWRFLYVTDENSDTWQLDQRTGAALWKQKKLHRRNLTAPAVYEDFVVVGDFEGYVHWLNDDDGKQMGRIRVTDEPFQIAPLIVDDIVYVYATDGTLAALKISQ
ncbi:MAG: outer membrane protein assembly factor BamB [Methylococcaceae bacterium]